MGITTIIAFILLILVVIAFIKNKRIVFILSLVLLVVVVISTFMLPELFQKSTDLSGERLNQIKIGSSIN